MKLKDKLEIVKLSAWNITLVYVSVHRHLVFAGWIRAQVVLILGELPGIFFRFAPITLDLFCVLVGLQSDQFLKLASDGQWPILRVVSLSANVNAIEGRIEC